MKGLNKVTLIGHLGKDPEFKTLDGGVSLAQFSLATSESFKDQEGNLQTQTEWHSIVAWRSVADIVQKLLKKGSLIFLEGKLKTRTFKDKNDEKKYVTEIIAENIILLDKS